MQAGCNRGAAGCAHERAHPRRRGPAVPAHRRASDGRWCRSWRRRERRAGAAEAGTVTIRLFDADRTDTALELDDALKRKVGDRQLLWIDVEGAPDRATTEAIGERLSLRPITRGMLAAAPREAHIALHGDYLHVRVATEADQDPSETPGWLDLIAAGNVVASWHAEPVGILRNIDDRIEADATIGQLDAAAFVASAIDSAVTSYFKSVDEIEAVVDRIDAVALGGDPDDDVLADLVAIRRRISRLRRVLSGQREVFAAFATPRLPHRRRRRRRGLPGVAVALRGRPRERREQPRPAARLVRSVHDPDRAAHQRHDEGAGAGTVLLLPGSLIAGLLG